MLMVPAAITTAFMMPIIGMLLQKGVPQQYLAGAGFILFAVFTGWCYFILTPDTNADNFFWPLIVRGVGMGMLFIPITTLSLSTLKGQEIGQGAAFTGMTRQLGGSFGIALITTFLSRQNVIHGANLGNKLDYNNPAVQQRLQFIQHGLINRGMSSAEALKTSYAAMQGNVAKQAAVLSYMDVFLYLGIAFLICVPFIMMVKGNKKKKLDLSEAMH
jgi:DHA2 family multidrug resistance protein